jgi:uncharacterized protein
MSGVIDNKANRIRVVKDILKHLHAGNPPSVQQQMKEIVRQTEHTAVILRSAVPTEAIRGRCR